MGTIAINAAKEDNMSGPRRADLSKGTACESPTGVAGVDTSSSPGTGQRPSIEQGMRFDPHVCSCPHRVRSRKSAKAMSTGTASRVPRYGHPEEMAGLKPLWGRASFPARRSKLENAASPTISLVAL
ncbi:MULTISPECIES: hypothetical protein [unclassified Mesorhizobium]|uniref:hypothetical protein n=1 Tax=unclassified Mesorhizobium TaxID=325217 RepID=UPI000FDAC12A|nr:MULTISPECIES: hypothetical protein [unclassified Mesorhizobium]RWE23334.1 MAG: hypothetical protein EOS41_21200 [Mesorhizobium sp.]TGQ21335.1 hypothetical protein EN860_014605 [Mesorhizobium sp. M00.F.Ca.ET.217.01.1.1]